MEQHIHFMVEEIANTYPLTDYFLKRHEIIRTKNFLQETNYALVMEWFPKLYSNWRDNTENPPGTVILEVDFHRKKLLQFTYVEPVKQLDFLPIENMEAITKWIKQQTGLIVDTDLKLIKQADHVYEFRAMQDHVPIYPVASIQIRYSAGIFQSFSMEGVFPAEEDFKRENFQLLPSEVQPIIEQQCHKMVVPNFTDASWQTIFGIEEIFITNDAMNTLPLDYFNHDASFVELNHRVHWQTAIPPRTPIKKQPIFKTEQVTLAMALEKEGHPDFKPISDWDILVSLDSTEVFLQRYYPKESGKWTIKKIFRQQDFIVVSLVKAHNLDLLKQKMHLYIDSKTKEVVNYLDSKFIYGNFNQSPRLDEVVITEAQALRKLYKHIRLTPIYVYDFLENKFILCGKLACPYGINAVTGSKVNL